MTDANPYQPPDSTAHPQAVEPWRRKGVETSVFMILAGLFFCIASSYVLLSHGMVSFWDAYQSLERLPVWFMIFYGFTSGLTALLHFSYLLRGRPDQAKAGIYAIGIAIGLTCLAAVVMENFARREPLRTFHRSLSPAQDPADNLPPAAPPAIMVRGGMSPCRFSVCKLSLARVSNAPLTPAQGPEARPEVAPSARAGSVTQIFPPNEARRAGTRRAGMGQLPVGPSGLLSAASRS